MNIDEIHHDLVIISLKIPDDASSEKVEISQLNLNWNKYPAPPALQRIGNAWLRSKSALLLYVPSAIDPLATNVLINPLHAEANKIETGDVIPFRFDSRLMKTNKNG